MSPRASGEYGRSGRPTKPGRLSQAAFKAWTPTGVSLVAEVQLVLVLDLVVLDDRRLLGHRLLRHSLLRRRRTGRVVLLLEGGELLLLLDLALAADVRGDDRLDLGVLQALGPVVPAAVAGDDHSVDPAALVAGHPPDQAPELPGGDLLADLVGQVLGQVRDAEDYRRCTAAALLRWRRALLGL